ncbi:MAG TPA: glucose 1-dehydrogenase [Burkholderiales bacterium]|nr:glucose 1-dehydrogenase [Burkholderiales bacterium]
MPEPLGFDLEGKVVLVTGAGRGIGRAIALACAQAGADLGVGSRHVEECERVAAQCRTSGVRASAWPLDVASTASIRRFVDAALGAYGKIDALVNNVGLTIVKPALELSEEEFDSISSVNLRAPFFASVAVARSMIERGLKGTIVNISSQVGHVGGPLRAAYAAAKGGLNSLTRSLAAEWAPYGIRVVGVSPTFTRTEMLERGAQNAEFKRNFERIPLGRPAEPEEVAAAVVYLASEAGRFVTGHTLLVDGGFTIV